MKNNKSFTLIELSVVIAIMAEWFATMESLDSREKALSFDGVDDYVDCG